jgi:hypothetical protein
VVTLARHQIHDWQRRPTGAIGVTCESTMAALTADEFTVPTVTGAGTPLSSAAMQLAGGADVVFAPGLPGRVLPGRVWGESRVEGLREVGTAWPARLRLDPWGRVAYLPPLAAVPVPVLSFTDGEGGTVVSADGIEDSREGVANVVVAEGEADGVAFRASQQVTSGPLVPSRYGRVVKRIKSDLIDSQATAVDVARAALSESVVRAQTWRVTCPPDWRVEQDDPVEVTHAGQTVWGWVTGVVMPVVAGDPMTFTVGVVQ